MFNETITRNISFGDPEPDLDRVFCPPRQARRRARFHHALCRLGYETKDRRIGDYLWSGGQKQRIASIAAGKSITILRSLIFDEATSALDTESERAIQDNLGRPNGWFGQPS